MCGGEPFIYTACLYHLRHDHRLDDAMFSLGGPISASAKGIEREYPRENSREILVLYYPYRGYMYICMYVCKTLLDIKRKDKCVRFSLSWQGYRPGEIQNPGSFYSQSFFTRGIHPTQIHISSSFRDVISPVRCNWKGLAIIPRSFLLHRHIPHYPLETPRGVPYPRHDMAHP